MAGLMTFSSRRARTLGVVAALGLALGAATALAQDEENATPGVTDSLPDFSQEAEEMSEAAKAAVEKFTAMIQPMLDNFGKLIEGLPRYEAPEVLANGDILIRRIPPGVETPGDEAPIDDQSDPTVTDL